MYLVEYDVGEFINAEKISNVIIQDLQICFNIEGNSKNFHVGMRFYSSFINNLSEFNKNQFCIIAAQDSVKSLGLTQRTLNCLSTAEIKTISQLLECWNEGSLNYIPRLGNISLLEIKDALASNGY